MGGQCLAKPGLGLFTVDKGGASNTKSKIEHQNENGGIDEDSGGIVEVAAN